MNILGAMDHAAVVGRFKSITISTLRAMGLFHSHSTTDNCSIDEEFANPSFGLVPTSTPVFADPSFPNDSSFSRWLL